MPKSIDTFINEVINLYGLKNITDPERRNLKFKLRMAEIQNVVKEVDTSLALDIVLGSVASKPIKGVVKTAELNFSTITKPSICPRCSSHLVRAKLTDLREVGYCESCHVAVAE
jgi:hypothetical protein